MGWQTAPARGSRQYRHAALLWIAVVIWLSGTATPTASAALIASGTPIAAGRVATISGLNMRAAPQTGAAVLRVLPFLAEVYILGSEVERDGHRWVPIRLKPEHGGQQGWVARRWVVALPLSAAHIPSSGSPGGTGLLADPQRLRVVKGSGDAQYAALNGVRYHIADLTTLNALNLGGYEQVTDAVIASLRQGPTLRFYHGALLKDPGDPAGRVWHISRIGNNWQRRWIPNPETFVALGLDWNHIRETPGWALERLPQGNPLAAPS